MAYQQAAVVACTFISVRLIQLLAHEVAHLTVFTSEPPMWVCSDTADIPDAAS